MKLYIKNMAGADSIKQVRELLDVLEITTEGNIRMGEILLAADTPPEKIQLLRNKLDDVNMFLIFDRKNILSEKVKHIIFAMVEKNDIPEQNYSSFISQEIHLNYTYLANIFSETQGITIEHFIIREKIKKASLLLQHTGFTIGQIANKLHYSSIGHFSGQFKKVTGLTPSQYKKLLESDEIPNDI